MTTGPKVLVAMSGGVDSSVAAALLVRAGYEVVGCFMRLGTPGESLETLIPGDEAEACATPKVKIGHQGCCSVGDAADARLVAAELGVPFYVCNFKRDFGRVIDYFVDEYVAGRTPNPCVRCNDWLKFGKLHEYARQIGASFVASGHYARIERARSASDGVGLPQLLRGVDHSKDQSYVLFGSPRERLAEMLLPIGGFEKSRVREMAREFGLPVFDKPDSQEICFIPDNDYAGLVERMRPELAGAGVSEGSIVDDVSGAVVGRHEGQHRFTIGQRRGLSLSLGHPVYVVGKDAATNTVRVGSRDALLATGLIAREVNWLVDDAPFAQWRPCLVKIRYNAEPVAARCRASLERDTLEVEFDEAQSAVAPGQAAVCYDAQEPDLVLGGGWISEATKA